MGEVPPDAAVVRGAHEELLAGKITPAEFVKKTGDAIEKIMLGAERQVVMSDADRRRTAWPASRRARSVAWTSCAAPIAPDMSGSSAAETDMPKRLTGNK